MIGSVGRIWHCLGLAAHHLALPSTKLALEALANEALANDPLGRPYIRTRD